MLQSIQQAMLTPSKILFYKIKCLCDRGRRSIHLSLFISDSFIIVCLSLSVSFIISLSPSLSPKHISLISLTIFLIYNVGIIIVGHNITKQLKCLNVQIPSQQYINTCELFRPHSDSGEFCIYLDPIIITQK